MKVEDAGERKMKELETTAGFRFQREKEMVMRERSGCSGLVLKESGGLRVVAGCWGEEKIQSMEGAGDFFFLGLEIGLGLGCFFVFFLCFQN